TRCQAGHRPQPDPPRPAGAARFARASAHLRSEVCEGVGMTAPRGWGLPESHLMPDAVVAFVDGELSHGPRDRAASHITRCAACAAEVRAQRQTVEAIRRAGAPSMSAGFLA